MFPVFEAPVDCHLKDEKRRSLNQKAVFLQVFVFLFANLLCFCSLKFKILAGSIIKEKMAEGCVEYVR